MLEKNKRIFVAGHLGMVGRSIVRKLDKLKFSNIITASSSELDLRNEYLTRQFIIKEKPEIVINAAAKVGGILANQTLPYEFLLDNMLIQNNLIRFSHENNVQKFIFLGSSCIYPKFSKQPIKEDYLLSDKLEKTNQWYAIAKISGLMLCQAINEQFNRQYVSLMPTNLYGPHDNFNLKNSHVLPAMIHKFHSAKLKNENVKLWGSGKPLREFLHVDDLADAIIFCLKNDKLKGVLNIGSGLEVSIKGLAQIIKKIVGFKGIVLWDEKKPDGTPRKLLDCSKINSIGWKSKIELEDGILSTYKWYIKNINNIKN